MCFSLRRNQGCSVKNSLDFCNLLIVDIDINSKQAAFIIDTGATDNFIDKTYIANNLASNKKEHVDVKVLLPNAEFVSSSTINLDFVLNNKTYNSSFIVSDFSNQIEYLKEQYDMNKTICGVIGNSFLTKHNAVINYKIKTVTL